MLSTKVVGNASQAQHYFLGHDNYYSENQTLEKDRSQWWGKGAVNLNLSGPVDGKTFTELLLGKLPNGEQLGLKHNGEIKHRAGFDLTFSAPKSVSIAALIGDDTRILSAMQRAADKTLNFIESQYAQARITKNGETTYENTGNLVAAKFLHDISREADPQLHVHTVIMNMTQRADGFWRSLASQAGKYDKTVTSQINGFIEQVRHHKKFLGSVFRAELAHELKALGYDIVKTNNEGFFEIAGFSEKVLSAYSERSKQITRYMEEFNFSGAKAAAVATIKTRIKKMSINRQNLEELWQSRAKAHDIDMKNDIQSVVAKAREKSELRQEFNLENNKDQSIEKIHTEQPEKIVETNALNKPSSFSSRKTIQAEIHKNEPIKAHDQVVEKLSSTMQQPATHEPLIAAKKAVLLALEKLSETQSVLNENAILQTALQYAVPDLVPIATLVEAFQAIQQSGDLILLNQENGQKTFITKQLLEYEKFIVSSVAIQNQAEKPGISLAKIDAYLAAQNYLSRDQKQAIQTIFNNPNYLTLVEGPAGSGKTQLIKPLMELAKLSGYQPVMLASNAAESLNLKTVLQQAPTNLREWLKSLFQQDQYLSVTRFIQEQETLLQKGEIAKKPLMIFVDNANLLSTQQCYRLMKISEQQQAKLVPIGDKASILSWRTGTPFTQLIENGAITATLSGNYRAQSPAIKKALADTLAQNTDTALATITPHLIAIEKKEERLNVMAAHFAHLPAERRAATWIVMPSRAACEEMNVVVHDTLKQEKQLGEKNILAQVLIPKYFSESERKIANHYAINQWVRFNEHYPALSIQKGEYLKITAIHPRTNQVVLENARQKTLHWNPQKCASQKTEVFEAKTRELHVGETLLCQRQHFAKKMQRGDTLTIKNIQGSQLQLVNAQGKTQKIDLKNPAETHFDYGYATTALQNHFKPSPQIIAYQSSQSLQSHQRSFYKTLSQATENLWIYTDHQTRWLNQVAQWSGDKTPVIQNLLQHYATPEPNTDFQHLLEQAVCRALENNQTFSDPRKTPAEIASGAVNYALAHLAEREAAFSHEAVLRVALTHALGEVELKTVENAVAAAEKTGELIRGIYTADGYRWTTREAIALEREILQLAKQDAGKLVPLLSPEVVEAYLTKIDCKPEHAQVIRDMLLSPDRVTMIQGYAGTGKTTLLAQAKPLIEQAGLQLLCLAPTHMAVKELRNRGLTAQTLESFLAEAKRDASQKIDQPGKRYIVVDEMSMISTRRMRDYLKALHHYQDRSTLSGDVKQYPAIESGKPSRLIYDSGSVKISSLTDIQRQKTEPLKQAVLATYQGQFNRAFVHLGERVIEIGREKIREDGKEKMVDSPDKRLEAVADNYLARSPEQRAKTMVIIFGNHERVLQNALIREGLKAEGELQGKAFVTPILVARDMTQIERTLASNYQVGDYVRFGYRDPVLNVQSGDYLKIDEIHANDNLLVLHNKAGQQVVWQPTADAKRHVEIYQAEKRELMVGDLIRWTRSDKERGLLSPEIAKVAAIDGQALQLVPLKGKAIDSENRLTIRADQPAYQHWDHAYAITGYSSQSVTVESVIVVAESYHRHLISQPAVIVALTRPEYDLTVYTDDKAALLEQIQKNAGEKTSALDTIGEKLPTEPTVATSVAASPVIKPTTPADAENLGALKGEKPVILNSSVSEKHKFKKEISAAEPKLEAKEINKTLRDQTEYVLDRLLGKPKEKTASQYRYGTNKGSLIVTIAGDKRGLWHDFQTGEGGNLLALIAREHGLDIRTDFKKVLQQANFILGRVEGILTQPSPTKREDPVKAAQPLGKIPPEKQKSVKFARQLVRDSQPIKGTLAERYLREHRGIHLEKIPDSFRFHPAVYSKINHAIQPALLAVAKDNDGKVQAVQAIFLDEKTAAKADVKVQKQTWGLPSQGTVNLAKNPDANAPVYLAEGPETGLSIYAALPDANVKITLGKSNFKNVDASMDTKNVVLCLDNDGNNPHTDKLIQFAVKRLMEAGKHVWLAMPEGVKDYNDLLKTQNLEAIKRNIENAVLHEQSSATLKNTLSDKPENVANLKDVFEQYKNSHEHEPVYQQALNVLNPHRVLADSLLKEKAALVTNEHQVRANTLDQYAKLEAVKNIANKQTDLLTSVKPNSQQQQKSKDMEQEL